ncbi:hypothetical protein NW762_000967 [Fusarium torreyae]|uniref:Restriction of telomere capping protein 4 n=1 Tax=Fusarium torreyae TaxID=1237075 RepID=A0A9W8VNK0_9HYPO|nr:hypothetical protein NW762_000967 [Fusarium torreyae]
MRRVLGMNRNQKPVTSLLSTFRDKGQGAPKRKLEDLDDVNALPMSSGDEAEDDMPSAADFELKPGGSNHQPPLDQSDDSEPERSGRGNIKRTNFANSGTHKTRKNATRHVSKNESKQSAADDAGETSSSSTKRRKLEAKSGKASVNQFTDDRGFTRSQKSGTTYGALKTGGSQGSRGSQKSRGSQSSQTKKGKTSDSDRKPVFNGVKGDGLSDSPRKDKPQFTSYSQESCGTPTKTRATMKSVPKDEFGTPGKDKENKSQITVPTSPTPNKVAKSRVSTLSQDDDPSRSRSPSQQRGSTVWNRKPLDKITEKLKRKRAKERSPTPEKPATFLLPVGIDSDNIGDNPDGNIGDNTGDNNSSASSQILSDLDQLSDMESINDFPLEDDESPQDRMTPCPWCGILVSEQALKDYSKGKRLNVNMQTKFCAKHQKETAMVTWRERGYPHIDWDRLEERLGDHREYLSKIVEGKSSYFRDILADKVETGQARSLKKEGNLNPGYYGPRGCKIMCDYLVEEFGESLKENATKDRVIAGRGSAAFIQSVLVAELAVQLIMEDMLASATEAREIMEESKALGELLHEEV